MVVFQYRNTYIIAWICYQATIISLYFNIVTSLFYIALFLNDPALSFTFPFLSPPLSSPRTTTTVGCRLSTSLKCDCQVLSSLSKTLCSDEQAGPLLGPSAYQDEAGVPGPSAELSLLQHWGAALKWGRRTQGGGGRSQLSRFESGACSGVTVARVRRQPPDI